MRRARAPDRRGFALLIVLWTLGLLALLGAQVTGAGRGEVRVADNLRRNAIAEAAADGAVHAAVFRLLQGSWVADAPPYRMRLGDTAVEVRLQDQGRRINPNVTPPATLQALLVATGSDPAAAARLARAITDWRTGTTVSLTGGPKLAQYRAAGLRYGPPNQPFANLDQLALVVGMTPAILARIRPYLSVYSEGTPQARAGDAVSADALAQAQAADPAARNFALASLNRAILAVATARTPDGGTFVREAVIRLRGVAYDESAPYQILTWETPAAR